MNLPNAIGLTGGLGAGKDFIAQQLIRRGYMPVSFADELRDDLCREYGVSLDEIFANKEYWRPIMQDVGDGCRQKYGDDYWLLRYQHRLKRLGIKKTVQTSIRYPNESEFMMAEMGALTARVETPLEIRKERVIARDGGWDDKWLEHPTERLIPTIRVHTIMPGTLQAGLIVPALSLVYNRLLEEGTLGK